MVHNKTAAGHEEAKAKMDHIAKVIKSRGSRDFRDRKYSEGNSVGIEAQNIIKEYPPWLIEEARRLPILSGTGGKLPAPAIPSAGKDATGEAKVPQSEGSLDDLHARVAKMVGDTKQRKQLIDILDRATSASLEMELQWRVRATSG
jgi:hypothetical protein